MNTARQLLLVLLVAITIGLPAPMTAGSRARAAALEDGALLQDRAAARSHTLTALTDEQSQLITWALSLFEAAGLELPGIDFVGYADRGMCHGRDGAALRGPKRTEVRICVTAVGPVQEWLVLHEIAHAWDHHTLIGEPREAFLTTRGLSSWRDGDWHERGAEHAAEIIVWGLMDRPVRPGRIYNNSCDELLAGYVALTGVAPLHGHTDACN
jgi:hypothetical protein